jgi:preprotein translocase subunit SecF
MRVFPFKPVEFIPHGTRIRFVSAFKICFGLSVLAIAATFVLLFTVGLNFGIDFRGGTIMEVKTPAKEADLASLREKLGHLGLGEVRLQTKGNADQVLIRIAEQPGGDAVQQEAQSKVRKALGPSAEVTRTGVVGGTVSKELVRDALIAIVLTCLVIFIYVWLRFEWQFALGCVIALIHDVMFTVGLFAVFQWDFDLSIVAALLTILAYSVNDTVVIYDRIRENLRKYKRMPLSELLDLSVNETLSRTIMTAGTAFVALLALFIFVPSVRGFTFAMLFGVVVGTYSSIFIAAPFLIMIGIKRDWSGTQSKQPAGRAGARSVTHDIPAQFAEKPLKTAAEPVSAGGRDEQAAARPHASAANRPRPGAPKKAKKRSKR